MFLIVVSLTFNLAIAVILYYLLGLEMQLYSLAGITISLSLIIDNTIVMVDHIKNRQNKEAFLPILTATITTMGALSIIFFLDEKIRLNLQDFAAVVIVNMMVSLLIALFFVPAMIDKMKMFREKRPIPHRQPKEKRSFFVFINRLRKRAPVYFSRYYLMQMRLFIRFRVFACFLIMLAFGLPFFMLPDKIEMKKAQTYSHTDSIFIEKYNEIGRASCRERV